MYNKAFNKCLQNPWGVHENASIYDFGRHFLKMPRMTFPSLNTVAFLKVPADVFWGVFLTLQRRFKIPCISISPVVRDAAARAPARRGAADEGGRVGARRDLLDDVEWERGRLVSPPPSSRCCLRRRPGNVAAARHCFWSTAIDRDLGPWKINEYIYSRTSRCLGP